MLFFDKKSLTKNIYFNGYLFYVGIPIYLPRKFFFIFKLCSTLVAFKDWTPFAIPYSLSVIGRPISDVTKITSWRSLALRDLALGDNATWYYHWVNLAISSAKRHVTNTEDIINAAARGHAHITLLDNRNLTKIWVSMSSYAATMGLTPMTTHYPDLLNYDANFIRRRMAEGNVDVTVYVSVPLTGPDAVMQVYMYTGMPFPVKPGFFVNIESKFQNIAISKGDRKFRAMTLNDFLKCKRVGDSYFCKDGNVVRMYQTIQNHPKTRTPLTENYA
jgi:hypothetical protein